LPSPKFPLPEFGFSSCSTFATHHSQPIPDQPIIHLPTESHERTIPQTDKPNHGAAGREIETETEIDIESEVVPDPVEHDAAETGHGFFVFFVFVGGVCDERGKGGQGEAEDETECEYIELFQEGACG
jgi:hypothetical protein